MKYHSFEDDGTVWKGLLMSPSDLAVNHIDLFYGVSLLFLIVAFFIRWNYITAILFCWLIINLNRVNFLLNNGSDSVLLVLSVWMIGMGGAMRNTKYKSLQQVIFNVSVAMCQLQIVLIYFVSGWDKLVSESWRSGDALAQVPHLDFMFNPAFHEFLSDGFTNATLSWITILFELGFVVLVWFNRTRLIVLAIGVIFHLMIAITLSLPDFAAVMIVSYLIFLKDSDYDFIQSRFKRLPQ